VVAVQVEAAPAVAQLVTDDCEMDLPDRQRFGQPIRPYGGGFAGRGLIQSRGEEIAAHAVRPTIRTGNLDAWVFVCSWLDSGRAGISGFRPVAKRRLLSGMGEQDGGWVEAIPVA